jgi:predicted flap endonuclease-1-like 5' DNA nuclease
MTIDPQLLVIAGVALLIGLFLGLAIRAPLKRRAAVLEERIKGVERERATLSAERDRLLGEVKTREAQIGPLAAELDKLRRDFARAQGQAPVAAMAVTELTALKGVGPKFAEKLRAAGIESLAQIAGWSASDVQVIDSQMGDFAGRIGADRLVEQARLLHEGRLTEYEALFGRLGG